MTDISFVICTYNPRLDLLYTVVDALYTQKNVQQNQFEVIVVDNRSNPPVLLTDLPPFLKNFKLVNEVKPGLTSARLKGAEVCCSPIIVYVDDDNILEPEYAEALMLLVQQHPKIGVFSSGKILPIYEKTPPLDIQAFWPYMALIDIAEPIWSNQKNAGVLPIGAGMAVREEVMHLYKAALVQDPNRGNIDRDGTSLIAGGDTDIGIVACNNGLGCGYFPTLALKHVIPPFRLEKKYLHRLAKDVSYSTQLVMLRDENKITSFRVIRRGISLMLTILSSLRHGDATQRISAVGRFRATFQVWVGSVRS